MKALSANEKLVLYGLVQYPTLNDRELSERIGLNHWTVNKIRNRLRWLGAYRTVRVPYLQHLGAEIFGVFYGRFPPFTINETTVSALKKMQSEFEEVIYVANELNQGFAFSVAGDYTSIKRDIYLFNRICQMQKSSVIDVNSVLFSFHLATFLRFFDYAPLLRHTFGLDLGEGEEMVPPPMISSKWHLNMQEKRVFYSLVRYPEMPDKNVAEMVGTTRQFVTKNRKRFEEAGLLKTMRIPDLKKLGFKVLALGHIRFRGDIELRDIKNHPYAMRYENNIILAVMEEYESVFLGVFKTFAESKKVVSRIIEKKDLREYFLGTPNILLFSIPDLLIGRELAFEHITRKMLFGGCYQVLI